jgi:hypothetical protein
MALKVVPAGDERCDIHNQRSSPTHICEACLKERGIEAAQPRSGRRPRPRRRLARARRSFRRWRSRTNPKVLIGGALGLLAVGVVVVAVASAGGGGGDQGGGGGSGPLEADVVNALGLIPDLTRGGWVTADSACSVVSIQLGKDAQVGNTAVEATNGDGTVRALVLPNDPSVTEAECVDRVSAALTAHF